MIDITVSSPVDYKVSGVRLYIESKEAFMVLLDENGYEIQGSSFDDIPNTIDFDNNGIVVSHNIFPLTKEKIQCHVTDVKVD